MAPTQENEYTRMAKNAEADLNTYQSKTGEARPQPLENVGVNPTLAEQKFPSSDIRYGDDAATNRGYNTRIPPEEGGDRDDRGRMATGKEYEGVGGPEDKLARRGGANDYDVVGRGGNDQIGNTELPREGILQEGQDAALHNVGRNPPGPGGQKYPPQRVARDEADPDAYSAQNNIPPESGLDTPAEYKR